MVMYLLVLRVGTYLLELGCACLVEPQCAYWRYSSVQAEVHTVCLLESQCACKLSSVPAYGPV